MLLFDFECKHCDHVFENWDTSDRTASYPCPECGTPGATRRVSTPRFDYAGMVTSGSGSTDGLSTSIDKWAKARKEKIKIEKRNMERHGTID